MTNYTKEIDFSRYSSIGIGPKADVLVINDIGEYSSHTILGLGNNVLISKNHPPFALLGEAFDYIVQRDNKLHVGCATKSGKLLSYAKKHNLANMEFLGKLPGSLGGLVKMNAGLKEYEIFNYIHSIKTNEGYIKKENIEYSYRHTNIQNIVYEVVFDIEEGFCKEKADMFKKMRDNQPNIASAGSCFKNPEGDAAGRLIEAVGLKGFEKGDMSFSKQHANFLVNHGKGSFDDALFLIQEAQQKVKEQFKIELQTEIIIF